MKSATQGSPTSYVDQLRQALPKAAFEPDGSKLVWMVFHLGIVLGSYVIAAGISRPIWILAPAIVAGHSLACIAFYVHDLSHGAVLRARLPQRASELIFLGLLLIAPTVWRRVHNQTHHAAYNTPNDPDRLFFVDESSPAKAWYVRLFFPNAETLPWNPLMLTAFIPYIVRNTVAGILPANVRPPLVPARARFKPGDSFIILLELIALAALQFGLFLVTGRHFWRYLAMSILANAFASMVVMSYVFTNHFLNPIDHDPDPMSGTTSVIVPKWLDRIHANFSYHTEHHIFPSMNSDYYPMVSQILEEKHAETYHRIPILEAWRRLWRNRPFVKRPH
jgi:fatty acid desaturase